MKDHEHDWKPGTTGKLFICKICGATAIAVPLDAKKPPARWYQSRYAFLAGGILLFAAIWLLSGRS